MCALLWLQPSHADNFPLPVRLFSFSSSGKNILSISEHRSEKEKKNYHGHHKHLLLILTSYYDHIF